MFSVERFDQIVEMLKGEQVISVHNFARRLYVSEATVRRDLAELEKQGFVVCRPGAKDRRYKCICSTEKSKQLRQEMAEVDRQVFDNLCSGLSGEQKASLIAMADLMLKNAGCCGKGNQQDD